MHLTPLPVEWQKAVQQWLTRNVIPGRDLPEQRDYLALACIMRLPLMQLQLKDVDRALYAKDTALWAATGCLPLRMLPNLMIIATSEPWNTGHLQQILQRYERGVKMVIITPTHYEWLLSCLHQDAPETQSVIPAKNKTQQPSYSYPPNASWLLVSEESMLSELLQRAQHMQASDIHLEKTENSWRLRYRINGELLVQRRLTETQGELLMKRIKLEARVLHSLTGSFVSSRIQCDLRGHSLDVRVEISPTITGESAVLRLLDGRSLRLHPRELGLPPEDYGKVLDTIQRHNGLIIVTGPTGSGKTTTLYTLLQYLNRLDKKIITIENPVEYRVDGLTQIQIDPDHQVTFPNAIRSCMRQDPDILLIGEVRDEETARLAVMAGETGHLVFTTLHTNNAIEAISRMEHLGVRRFQLQTLLQLVIAQRLAGRLCPECKTPRPLKPEERDWLLNCHTPIPDQVYERRGCSVCHGTGLQGRRAIYSCCFLTPRLRELLGTSTPMLDILRAASEDGFKTVMERAIHLWTAGEISLAEVLALEN